MITTKDIKTLRDLTGISVMQCKKALEEALGDMAKAKEILKTISKSVALKKADRELKSGVISSYIHGEGAVGVMVELLCESDFVARNDTFKQLARDIAMHVAAMSPENAEELLEQEFIKSSDKTIKNLLEEAAQKFGEKTEVGRFARFSVK